MGENVTGKDGIKQRVQEIMDEPDPQRRQALSRRLRAEVWDLMSEDDKARVQKTGLDLPMTTRGLKEIE